MGIFKGFYNNHFLLPKWCRLSVDGYLELSPSIVFPMAFRTLDMVPSAFSTGIAMHCISRLLRHEIVKEPIKIRYVGKKSQFLKDRDADKWAPDSYPEEDEKGRTYSQGCSESAQHYERFKKHMPRRLTI